MAKDYLKELLDVDAWRKLAPMLTLDSKKSWKLAEKPISFDKPTLKTVSAGIKDEGYFILPPLDWGVNVGGLAQVITKLQKSGRFPVFSYVYDEPWIMFARLRTIMQSILSKGYVALPAFWAWRVDGVTSDNKSGWEPHRDCPEEALCKDGSPRSFSLWVPLTEATTKNGCMYLVPANRDPEYGNGRDIRGHIKLQDVRALPAPAGSLMGWTQAVYHWGSRANPSDESPRISLSMEFQRGDEPAIYTPFMDPQYIPTLEEKVDMILFQINNFSHMLDKQSPFMDFVKEYVRAKSKDADKAKPYKVTKKK